MSLVLLDVILAIMVFMTVDIERVRNKFSAPMLPIAIGKISTIVPVIVHIPKNGTYINDGRHNSVMYGHVAAETVNP